MKKRNIALVILLGFVTCGIYFIVLHCMLGSETNRICEGDGKKNMHWLLAALLGVVTLGIYPIFWCAKAMDRLQDNSYRYPGVNVPYDGGNFWLWELLGLFIGIGPLVALAHFVKDVNAYADSYGYFQPLPYTANKQERVFMASNQVAMMGAPMGGPMAPPMPPAPAMDVQPPMPPVPPVDQQFVPAGPGAVDGMAPMPPIPPVDQAVVYDDVPPTSPAPNIVNTNTRSIMGHPPYGQVECLNGEYAGGKFDIQNGEEVLIGKDASCCQIVIAPTEQFVSRKHARIGYNAEMNKYIVTDFSTNGTFTGDGQRLESGKQIFLDHGTVIYLGERTNSFSLN